jgi:hypothetical protein
MYARRFGSVLVLLVTALPIVLTGCGSTSSNPPADQVTAEKTAGHSHEGWWCDEHGVPEEICALCDSKVAAKLKKNGDWCQEHDRPDSQCFVCHPEQKAKFAAQYAAKYGKQPPEPAAEPKS